VLQILGDHGVTKEEIELLKRNPKGIGKNTALGLKRAVAISTLIRSNLVHLIDATIPSLCLGCQFVNVGEVEMNVVNELTDRAGDAADLFRTGSLRDVGIFQMHKFQFEGVSAPERIDRIAAIMFESGYMPAPFRLFLRLINQCLGDMAGSEKALFGHIKLFPLVNLDPFFMVDGHYMAVINRVPSFTMPQLELGHVDLLRDEKMDPSKYLYLGFRND
jgi:hypothetical protein